jgi:ABC-type transport system involved in Fe-S cluster assembly fused permease/ATPase subunit
MSTVGLAIIIGVILAIPCIYILELENPGAITLLIFVCCGIVYLTLTLIKFISSQKKRRRSDANHSTDS